MKNFPANNNPIDWVDILNQVQRLAVGGADDRQVWCNLAASLHAAGGTDTHKQIFLSGYLEARCSPKKQGYNSTPSGSLLRDGRV